MTGKQILRLRKRLGMTQTEFAVEFNLGRTAIGQWETGDTHPTGAAVKILHNISQRVELLHRMMAARCQDRPADVERLLTEYLDKIREPIQNDIDNRLEKV